MLKINNPLSLRPSKDKWQGMIPSSVPGYIAFSGMDWGYRAGILNLITYFNLKLNSVSKILYTWAPPKDGNDTEAYIKNVCSWTGYKRDQVLQPTESVLKSLAAAMSRQENGVKADLNSLYRGYDLIKKK